MLRNVLLRGASELLQLLHALLALAHGFQHANAHRLSKDAKALGDPFDQRCGQRVWKLRLSCHGGHDSTTIPLYASVIVVTP